MKRMILIALVLAVGCAVAGWRGRFDEQFAAALNAGTPIPAVAWYKLDGNALDSSGNGYNGTWSGTEAYAAGKFAGTQAASFGRSSRITIGTGSIGDVDLFMGGAKKFTVAFWIKQSDYSGAQTLFSKFGTSSETTDLWIELASSSNVRLYSRGWTPENIVFTPGSTWANGTWRHVSISWDGNTGYSSIDGGAKITLRIGTASTTSHNTDICIGGRSSGTYSMRGLVTDFRVYDRALSVANIQRIMTGQDVAPIEELQ